MHIYSCVHIDLCIYVYTSIGDLKPFQPFINLMLPVAIFHSFSDDRGSMEGGASRHAQCFGSSLASRRFVWGRHIPIVSTGRVYLPTWMVDLHGKCRYAGMPYVDPMGCRKTKIVENMCIYIYPDIVFASFWSKETSDIGGIVSWSDGALYEFTPTRWSHFHRYGEHWGEGAARCFSLEADILDEELGGNHGSRSTACY